MKKEKKKLKKKDFFLANDLCNWPYNVGGILEPFKYFEIKIY